MPRYLPEPVYHHGSPALTAVLLINLGTPTAPTAPAVRRYLGEFLADPRVVEIPRPIWWLILHAIILNVRPRRSAEKYASVWTADGSPLKVHTERQARLLRGFLGQAGHRVVVDYAMRYGQPSIPATLSRLKAEGCTRILLLPLYPQYAASTTATAFDAVGAWLQSVRNQPEMRSVRSFADHPGYIAALAASVREHWAIHARPTNSYRLLMSFHGLPRYTLDKGDPYHCECQKTGRLLAEALGLAQERYQICFQSRFGRAEWLQPYTAATLQALGKQGLQRVDVICPGFRQTVSKRSRKSPSKARASSCRLAARSTATSPALNERDDWMHALTDIAASHLQGWPTQTALDAAGLELSALRARAMGAPF
jgi:ferrochelatase